MGSYLGHHELVPLPPWTPRFFRRSFRRLIRYLGNPELEFVYHNKYNAAFPSVPNDALRAERILAFLASEGFVLRCSVHRPEPVWIKALEMVHDAAYLDSLHVVNTLTSIMGTEVTPDQLDRLIDLQRIQTGGTLMATRRARQKGVGVNLGGGFHHAHAGRGGGFCIFNDVAIAIADERRHGLKGPILVVDLDYHDGDGTRAIFADDPSVHTFSIHARHWGPTEAKASTSIELGNDLDDEHYLAAIEEHLPPLVQRLRPKLLFYLAGCDPAHDDLLGSWNISTAGMLKRDRRVFALARGGFPRIPLVVLLAGGYGQQTWRYTARFLSNLKHRKRLIEPPTTEEITLKRYRYISQLIPPAELSGGDPKNEFGLTEDDLFMPAWGMKKETRLLGFYTKNGLELLLERSGFLERLRDLGFQHPTLTLQLDSPEGQNLRIFGDPDHEELLVELLMNKDRRSIPGFELLSIEWLLLQNPRVEFSPARPRLPGQDHPGLGMLGDVVALLRLACERLHLDGLIFVPSKFHIAAYTHGHLTFLTPDMRARYCALLKFFNKTPLVEATRAVDEGKVVDTQTGEVYRWQPQPMVLPISDKLGQYMKSLSREKPGDYTFAWV